MVVLPGGMPGCPRKYIPALRAGWKWRVFSREKDGIALLTGQAQGPEKGKRAGCSGPFSGGGGRSPDFAFAGPEGGWGWGGWVWCSSPGPAPRYLNQIKHSACQCILCLFIQRVELDKAETEAKCALYFVHCGAQMCKVVVQAGHVQTGHTSQAAALVRAPAVRLDRRAWHHLNSRLHAGMAELVDAVDSKSTGRKALGVRVPLPVPSSNSIRSKTVQEALELQRLTPDVMSGVVFCCPLTSGGNWGQVWGQGVRVAPGTLRELPPCR